MAAKKRKPDLAASWPASSVELWPLEKIVEYPKNPRTHPQSQIDLIASSMRDDGVTSPILVDEAGVIIYGHGRRLAALQNGYKQYPVVIARGWSDDKKRAVRLKDNSYAALSGWSAELILPELQSLKLAGFDMQMLGFPESQLRSWGVSLGTDSEQDPEAAPPLPKNPVVRRGDLWKLGAHRLLCADCTEAENIKQVIDGKKAQLVFTDPPYGVDYTGGMKLRERLNGDHVGTDIYFEALQHLKFAADDNAALYLWYADAHAAAAAAAAAAAGYQIVAQIIWAKNHAQFVTSAHYKGKHEPCFYAHRKGKSSRWNGPNNEVTLWECNRSPRNDYHPTQKPVELAERAIRNSSSEGHLVLDLFVGGGGTIIAAELTGRKAIAMEIDPGYTSVAVERWQTFTGKKATLAATGQSYAEVAAERAPTGKGKRKGRQAASPAPAKGIPA